MSEWISHEWKSTNIYEDLWETKNIYVNVWKYKKIYSLGFHQSKRGAAAFSGATETPAELDPKDESSIQADIHENTLVIAATKAAFM